MKHRRNFEFSPKMLLILLTVICMLLLSVSVLFKDATRPFTSIVAAVVIPMQDGINSVGVWVSDRAGSMQSMEELRTENEQLRQQVEDLTRQNASLQSDQSELEELRSLFALSQQYVDYTKIGARVISSGSGNWYENFVINKGSDDGIAVNMNVLAGDGLVGIVTEVGHNFARVQSIISDDSSVSAMSASAADTCVVKGNSESARRDGVIDVTYISKDATMVDGEELVTSNISSKYLPGLKIGTVSGIEMDSSNLTKSAKLTPVVDFQHVDEVLVITQLKEVPAGSESAD
ncbi:MAG TPA: rod shape-determining protein MreC [Candidatus Anaerobutyricum stercoripullorum]|uniref:Cell shape-determining protein MreC n=1 Tax=Candidatus Anaerobutyricum stercoripullorum TaxID=2838456 RepID=A0A9D1X334_9FIRM|nr:rod shape-determining protein MreC [Candidatus Anaerobutyricum stercoripullorum]